MPAVTFRTLGCKLNYSETATYARQFQALGYTVTKGAAEADVVVVNTCAVTEQAQRKARQLVHHLKQQNPHVRVVVAGCYAQLSAQELEADAAVDMVLVAKDKPQLALLVHRRLWPVGQEMEGVAPELDLCAGQVQDSGPGGDFFHAYSSGGRTRAFLKVQDGCSYRCTYCAIPQARGESRSPRIADIVREAEQIASRGVREIVLTGVNTGDFGRTTGEAFIELLRALERVEGIARYRISSVEPNLLTDGILAFMGSSGKFLPHIHLPLQSGSSAVLRAMGRRYTTRLYRERVEAVRRYLCTPFLGVDVIVGFPGETDADFAESCQFIELLEPSYLHVFPYSRRPGTLAATLPGQVEPGVLHARVQRLLSLSDTLHRRYCLRFEGQVRPVLVERVGANGNAQGFTDNYIRTRFSAEPTSQGHIARVRLKAPFEDGAMRGECLELCQ